jgi:hypothetical protein
LKPKEGMDIGIDTRVPPFHEEFMKAGGWVEHALCRPYPTLSTLLARRSIMWRTWAVGLQLWL